MKLLILIGATAGGLLGSWLGSLFDHGNMLGLWGIMLSTLGGIAGVYAGYKIYTEFME